MELRTWAGYNEGVLLFPESEFAPVLIPSLAALFAKETACGGGRLRLGLAFLSDFFPVKNILSEEESIVL